MRCGTVNLVSKFFFILLLIISFSCDSDIKYKEQKKKEKETLDNLEVERRAKLEELEKLKNEIAGLRSKNDSLDTAIQFFDSTESQTGISRLLDLDHLVIAVKNLEQSKNLFESRLGFTLKPGRLHPNGIKNEFVKFRNGSYIELLTVETPEDKISIHYSELLKSREGGAFAVLKSDSLAKVTSFFNKSPISAELQESEPFYKSITLKTGGALKNFFLIEYLAPQKENPSFTNHLNGVSELFALWINTPDLEKTLREFSDLKFEIGGKIKIPVFAKEGITVDLNKGKIYLFENAAEGSIIGMTLICKNIKQVSEILRSNGLKFNENLSQNEKSILLLPNQVYGLWIEFIESK